MIAARFEVIGCTAGVIRLMIVSDIRPCVTKLSPAQNEYVTRFGPLATQDDAAGNS